MLDYRHGPRGFPTALPEFQHVFPDDSSCTKYLENLRWPHGFTCPKCEEVGEPYRFPKQSSVVLRCRGCQSNVSLTACSQTSRHGCLAHTTASANSTCRHTSTSIFFASTLVRFYPMTAFNSVLGLAAHAVPPTYAALYSDEWDHPTG